MKTSLELEDKLAKEVKMFALRRGLSFRALCEMALRDFIARSKKQGKPFALTQIVAKSAPSPECQAMSWADLRRTSYEGRGE